MADEGGRLVGSAILDEITAGESASHTFRLDPEQSCFVYGACDDDCSDIDMVGEDAADDHKPILIILRGESGDSLTVTLDLVTRDADICVVGMGLCEVEL